MPAPMMSTVVETGASTFLAACKNADPCNNTSATTRSLKELAIAVTDQAS